MENFLLPLNYLFWFLVMLTAVVFIHEFGHYLVARLCGVKVEVFSIGFGKELFGFNDRHGTRWKISLLPFGGYVKMFGDSDPSSSPDAKKLKAMKNEDKKQAFHFKNLRQKAAIVVAGPMFNYISAILIITAMMFAYGRPSTEAIITEVIDSSPAKKAGIMVGDKIISVDDSSVDSFEDVRKMIALNVGTPMIFTVLRHNEPVKIEVTPELRRTKDIYGNPAEMPVIGIASKHFARQELNLPQALYYATAETINISAGMIKALGQMIAGERSMDQLGGPVKIAQYSGQSAKYGVQSFLWFIALISINLGLINLFPIPMLDGGHLAYYLVESLTGKPVAEKFQMAAMRISFALLMGLMLLVTFHDVVSLFKSH